MYFWCLSVQGFLIPGKETFTSFCSIVYKTEGHYILGKMFACHFSLQLIV
jgi:hypothetical protein